MRPISTSWSAFTCRANASAADLEPASLLVEPRHHHQCALVVIDHVPEEEAVERPAAGPAEPLQLRRREHPRHKLAREHAVGVAVGRVEHGRRLASVQEPAPHQLDLGLLRQRDAPATSRTSRPAPVPRRQCRHRERLGMVVDHPLHEADVRVVVPRRLEVRELVLGERPARLAGGAGLDDVRRGLPSLSSPPQLTERGKKYADCGDKTAY